jgi:hypothetical protein
MDEWTKGFVGRVETLHRYPVKSMLGETRETLSVSARGIDGDRSWALVDAATGKVASAKRPKLWRSLLSCSARSLAGHGAAIGVGVVEIEFPNGARHRSDDLALDGLLSRLTGRQVKLASVPPPEAKVDRAHPEAQLAKGLDSDVASDILELGAAAPPGTFLDYAPVHVLTTATLDGFTSGLPDGPIEAMRYRPNVLIRSPASTPRFPENGWLGSTLRIGDAVELRVVLQTPRCATPMLAQGALPPRPDAVRLPAERNRVEIPGFGNQPCAGIYAEVLQAGSIRQGDPVILTQT